MCEREQKDDDDDSSLPYPTGTTFTMGTSLYQIEHIHEEWRFYQCSNLSHHDGESVHLTFEQMRFVDNVILDADSGDDSSDEDTEQHIGHRPRRRV